MTWQSFGQDGSVYAVAAQKFDKNGAKVGGEFPVNTYTSMNQSQPRIAALGKRGFVIAWNSENEDGDGYGVYGQRFR